MMNNIILLVLIGAGIALLCFALVSKVPNSSPAFEITHGSSKLILPVWAAKILSALLGVGVAMIGLVNNSFMKDLILVKMTDDIDIVDIYEAKEGTNNFLKLPWNFFIGKSQDFDRLVVRTREASYLYTSENRNRGPFYTGYSRKQGNPDILVDVRNGINGYFPVGVIFPAAEEFDDCYNEQGKFVDSGCVKVISPGKALAIGLEVFKLAHQDKNITWNSKTEAPFTSGTPTSAETLATSLVAENVVAILGSYNSSSTARVLRAVKGKGILLPVISPSSSASTLKDVMGDSQPWFFRFTSGNQRTARFLAKFVNWEFPGRDVALVYAQESSEKYDCKNGSEYAENLSCLIHAALEDSDAAPMRRNIVSYGFPAKKAEVEKFQDILNKIIERKVKLVVLIGLDQDIINMARALHAAKNEGKKVPSVFIPGHRQLAENKQTSIHKLLEGFIHISSGYSNGNYRNWDYDKSYRQYIEKTNEYSGPPPDPSFASFDSASIIGQAIQDLRKDEALEKKYGAKLHIDLYRWVLRAKINDVHYEGASGYIVFDQDGQSSISMSLLKVSRDGVIPYAKTASDD